MSETILDNPAWEALLTEQAIFAVGALNAKRYRADTLPFIACRNSGRGCTMDLDPFIGSGESFFVMGDLPQLPAGWVVEHELPCAQMLLQKNSTELVFVQNPALNMVKLDAADAGDMLVLISQVQPGYFLHNTGLLGNYYGIRDNSRLVAMAGERMRVTGYTELSAICTLPEYTGRGYAQQLIGRLCADHAAAGIRSFLHVSLSNQRAISLYEHMGFALRREIVFTRLNKPC